MPPGLDGEGQALHALIAARARGRGENYWHAFAHIAGDPSLAILSDVPTEPATGRGFNPEAEAHDAAVRSLAASAGISWLDALAILDSQSELDRIRQDTGAASEPWLDSRLRPSAPRPWSDEDWARDQRRAAAAGIEIDRATWAGAAEGGQDIVGLAADEGRAVRLATAQAMHDPLLPAAQDREDLRRSSAISNEQQARARKRLGQLAK